MSRTRTTAQLIAELKKDAAIETAEPNYIRWVTASQGPDLRLVTTDDICYFKADNKCTLVVTASQESLIYRSIRAGT